MPPRCTSTPASRRRSPCTSRGTRSTTTPTSRSMREGPRRRARHDQLEHLPGRRLQARQSLTHSDARIRQKAIDHHFDCIDVMDETGLARPQDLARRRHQLPGPGRHARPPGPPRRVARRRSTSASATSQRLVLEYKFFEPAFYHTDVPDWGTSYVQVAALGDARRGLPRHRPPRPRHQHRVHRHAAAAPRKARLVRLQLALLRRRRPHRGRGRPVPAVPHPRRGGPRRRLRRRRRRRVHARPVPQHRGQDPRADPLACSTCRR